MPSRFHFMEELAAQLQGGQLGGRIQLSSPSGSASAAQTSVKDKSFLRQPASSDRVR